MPKSTLFLDELHYTLQYWEDVNLHAEVFFQAMKSGKINNDAELQPFIGSEVDKMGFLMRAIKNFKGFRSSLENHIEIDVLQYLPRVPKDFRDRYEALDFMRTYCFTSISPLPYMLKKWQESKKVFVVDKLNSIPIVDVSTQNYLNRLPHQSFVLKFNDPVLVTKIFTDVFFSKQRF